MDIMRKYIFRVGNVSDKARGICSQWGAQAPLCQRWSHPSMLLPCHHKCLAVNAQVRGLA